MAENGNPLQEAISTQDWEKTSTLLTTDEGIELTKVVDSSNRLPLHNIFNYRRAPNQLILELIKANNEAVKAIDKDKLYPLHHATHWGASPSVIEALIKIHPQALDEVNAFGETPRDLLQFGTLNKKSRSMISKPTGYWETMAELQSKEEKLIDYIRSGSFVSSAKQVLISAIDELEEFAFPDYNPSREEEKKADDSDNEFNRWAYLKMKSDNTFALVSRKAAFLLKEIEKNGFYARQSKLQELETRLASLEDVYRHTNIQLEKTNLDYSRALENQEVMQQKLEETESILERTLTELTALRTLKDIENHDISAKENEKIKHMEQKLSALESTFQKAVDELEEGKVANLEMIYNGRALDRKVDATKIDMENIKNLIITCKADCEKSLLHMKENEKICTVLEASLRRIIQDQKESRLPKRIGDLELAFQSAINGINALKKENEKLNGADLTISTRLHEHEKVLKHQDQCISKHERSLENNTKKIYAHDISFIDIENNLKTLHDQIDSMDVASNHIKKRVDGHEKNCANLITELKSSNTAIESLRVALDCNTKSFDEKISISSKIIAENLTKGFEAEIKAMKERISLMQGSKKDIQELKNEMITLEAQWATKYEMIEKEVASATSRIFDGDDWEVA